VHLDRGYDSGKTRSLLDLLGFTPQIAVKGQPAPIQAGHRWPVERTHSWMNGYGKLRRCTDKLALSINRRSLFWRSDESWVSGEDDAAARSRRARPHRIL
jgi:hypothetical protein